MGASPARQMKRPATRMELKSSPEEAIGTISYSVCRSAAAWRNAPIHFTVWGISTPNIFLAMQLFSFRLARLYLLLVAGLPALLCAQNLGGGVSVGAIFSQVDGDTDGGFRQLGLSLGGFVNYALSDRLYLQPEMVYEQLGSRQRQGFFVLRSHHISFPVLLRTAIAVDLGDGSQEILLEGGPVIGVLLSASERISGQDQTPFFRRADFRGVVGGSYRLSERWAFSLRYGYSLVSFLQNNPPGSFPLDPTRGGLFHHYVKATLRYHLAR